jgi:hypothetical protein
MANALVEKLRSEEQLDTFDTIPVTRELFWEQYLKLDKPKKAVVDKYYRHDSFLVELLRNSPSTGLAQSRLCRFFELISSSPRILVHMMLRFRVSAYAFMKIRPFWKEYLTTLGPELESSE